MRRSGREAHDGDIGRSAVGVGVPGRREPGGGEGPLDARDRGLGEGRGDARDAELVRVARDGDVHGVQGVRTARGAEPGVGAVGGQHDVERQGVVHTEAALDRRTPGLYHPLVEHARVGGRHVDGRARRPARGEVGSRRDLLGGRRGSGGRRVKHHVPEVVVAAVHPPGRGQRPRLDHVREACGRLGGDVERNRRAERPKVLGPERTDLVGRRAVHGQAVEAKRAVPPTKHLGDPELEIEFPGLVAPEAGREPRGEWNHVAPLEDLGIAVDHPRAALASRL